MDVSKGLFAGYAQLYTASLGRMDAKACFGTVGDQ